MQRLLITGISGGQGRLLTRRLAGTCEIVGVDRRTWDERPQGVEIHEVDLRSRHVDELFRRLRPDAVAHLGLVRHQFDAHLRHDVNVVGTKHLLECCAEYGVDRVVVMTSSYVYGALPENPFYMDEDTALNVSRHYPEIRDLAEVDALATGFLWRYPEIATAILRPVNTLGRSVHSSIGAYLKPDYVPTILGFDPLLQFIHEQDLTESIVSALESRVRGVFNIVGPGAVPLSVAVRETGSTAVPLPEPLAVFLLDRLFRYGLFPVPADAVDFVKYPCTIDGRRFQDASGFEPLLGLEDTLRSVRT
ncbi:MAG: NAD-dependent epimerase/dehydratase family protein [Candidatus Binatia bacterium]|nr:NAD-dependent epimerase/dehydratase family protein [Candidatus Binatia bacterium]